ncbi:hypothetical protein [Roseisolibacter sp. H3M3-2]|uniref:hypothetical protein n=1 Tax=Roseisolibacter sp. H3M3-2 TaxID=3031323 RepID=UPI0023DC8699|nr:hypothetical protein [Roseisolibacter sp. H3M3-2]MDF1503838.1 hypothetical protein [Roseisolibacter sp. H3M3-2]
MTPLDPQAASAGAVADPTDAAHLQARLEDRDHRKGGLDPLHQVRATDIEPYTGLGYLSKLFRLIAILLLVLLVAEVGVGVYSEGIGSLRTLITEASRLIVVAGVLWGAGDLATLLIDIGHDVRATRVLLGRQVAHPTAPPPAPAVEVPVRRDADAYRPTALPRRALGDAPEQHPE